MNKDFQIKEEELEVLDEVPSHKGIHKLRIVRWNDKYVNLEKREYYTDDEGNMKMGKVKGLSLGNLLFIRDKLTDIIDTMNAAQKGMT